MSNFKNSTCVQTHFSSTGLQNITVTLKPTEHSLGINMGEQLKVLCASFEENCAQTRTLSNTPFNMRGNQFLVYGTEKDLPQFSCFFHLFNMSHTIFRSQTFNMTLLHWDSCLNYIFRWVLSSPKFCFLSPQWKDTSLIRFVRFNQNGCMQQWLFENNKQTNSCFRRKSYLTVIARKVSNFWVASFH